MALSTMVYRQIAFDTKYSIGLAGRAFSKPNDSIEVYFEYRIPINDLKNLKKS
jgi:hypothetical protein